MSGLAVTGEDVERVYTANLYYIGSEPHSREIHFVVNWDNEINKAYISEQYSSKRAILGVNHFVEFEEDSITLDIPMDGVDYGGWRITPIFYPTIYKKHVDQFKPGRRIPYCHLNAEWTNKRKNSASKLFHKVRLLGAKDPYNIITINLDPQRILPVSSIDIDQPDKLRELSTEDKSAVFVATVAATAAALAIAAYGSTQDDVDVPGKGIVVKVTNVKKLQTPTIIQPRAHTSNTK